jgi:hypothetical protein
MQRNTGTSEKKKVNKSDRKKKADDESMARKKRLR